MTNMSDKKSKEPLLDSVISQTHLSWYWATLFTAIILILTLVLVEYFSGAFKHGVGWETWRVGLQAPSIIIYILVIYPIIEKLWKRALEAFRPLVTTGEREFNHLIAEASKIRRWREWLSVLVGFIFMLVISRPWLWVDQWIDIYQTVTTMLMFGLLGWLIYSSIESNRVMSILCRQDLKIDIFNTNLLSPVARLSLGNSLAFIGGISLSMVFQTQENLLEWQTITVYSVLILATILIFFMSMWNVHKILANIKSRELNFARDQLTFYSRELKNKISESKQHKAGQLSLAVAGWAAYENKIRETQEWPFNAAIIRRLFASVLAPASIYLIKILSVLGIKVSF